MDKAARCCRRANVLQTEDIPVAAALEQLRLTIGVDSRSTVGRQSRPREQAAIDLVLRVVVLAAAGGAQAVPGIPFVGLNRCGNLRRREPKTDRA